MKNYTELDVLNYIYSNYDIINIKDIIENRLDDIELCEYEVCKESIDDLEYIDTIEELLDYEGELLNISIIESYNLCSQANINYSKISIENTEYNIIRFHKFGDARANYIMIDADMSDLEAIKKEVKNMSYT